MVEQSGGGVSWWRKALISMALKGSMRDSTQSLSTTDVSGWNRLFNMSYTGKAVNDETAMQVSTVWACVKILAESVGMLPLGIYEKQKNGNSEKVDHPLAEVLVHSPNADMTSQEYREAGQVNLGLQGNAYSFVERNGAGQVSSLYPIESKNVVPERDRDTGRIQFKVNDRGQWNTYPREKIWHVKGFGNTGLIGYSPIGAARQAMGISLATEEFQARFFANGARPSAVVTVPAWLDDKQRPKARENLQQLLGGLQNAHKVALLEGGMTLGEWGMPLDDLQFVELRRFQLHEICRMYRVPPHMVADLERATFSNIEQMSLEFVQFTLLPWLRRWEESAERWLLKPGDRSKYMVRFNFEGLLRADTAARSEYLAKMVANGMMSRNEARAKENLNSVTGQGMDDYTVQSNMVTVGNLDAIALRNSAPRSTPAEPKHNVIMMPAATAPEVKVNVQGPTVEIPENARHALVDQIAAMGKAAEQTLRYTATAAELAADRDEEINRTLKGLNDNLQKIAQRRRYTRLITDANGDPIGTEETDTKPAHTLN
jgi:HK97 family phage portal protein